MFETHSVFFGRHMWRYSRRHSVAILPRSCQLPSHLDVWCQTSSLSVFAAFRFIEFDSQWAYIACLGSLLLTMRNMCPSHLNRPPFIIRSNFFLFVCTMTVTRANRRGDKMHRCLTPTLTVIGKSRKSEVRREGTLHQLWARQQVVVNARAFLWNVSALERWISVIGGAGTAFPCVQQHFNHCSL